MVVEKLIFKATMLQNLVSFYFWNQKLYLKTKSYFDHIWEKKITSTPFTFTKCNSFEVAPMMLKFWKNIPYLLN
jgi:hypothetical protein